jgi:hypothetical protein
MRQCSADEMEGDSRRLDDLVIRCAGLVAQLTSIYDRSGVDVYPPSSDEGEKPQPLGKSSIAGTYAIGQTAASRVFTNMWVP